jgi:outer membrane protein OmpA-like peptidoglycan-associated protein
MVKFIKRSLYKKMLTLNKYGFLILCLLAVPAFAQTPARGQTPARSETPERSQSTAAEIETLLNAKTITYAQASRFVLEAANVLATDNHEEAFNYAVQQNWLSKKLSSSDPARLNYISLLLMRSFDAGGGIMYSITKSPRYAYRELAYLSVIQNRSDPSMFVSGEQLLYYISRIIDGKDSRADEKRQAERRERETRRHALAAEITSIIEEQKITDTTVKATNEGVLITLSNIMFAADSAELPTPERVKIREIARVLRSIPGIKIQVAGHTTIAGTETEQLELSKARAQSVADYLVSLGACEKDNVSIIGYGSRRPIADNSTPQGMAANRRVDITILEN